MAVGILTKKLAPLSGAFVALLAAFLLQAGLNIHLRSIDVPALQPAEDFGKHWDSRAFRVLTFGELPSAVDWYWVQASIDPSLSKVSSGIHPAYYHLMDFITDLDPAFFEAYYAGANILAVIRDDGVGARDLLLKARRFSRTDLADYPEEFQTKYWGGRSNLSILLAYVYLFELKDMPNAAKAFQDTALEPGAPGYVLSLAERLKTPDGAYEVGIKLLRFLAPQQKEPVARARLEEQGRALEISRFVFNLNREFQSFAEKNPSVRSKAGLWSRYLKQTRASSQDDPWGGKLALDENGRVVTSTAHQKVFGLE